MSNERSAASAAADLLKQDLDKASSGLVESQKGKRVSIMAGGGILLGVIYAVIRSKGFIGAVGYGMMGMALGTGVACISAVFVKPNTNGTT